MAAQKVWVFVALIVMLLIVMLLIGLGIGFGVSLGLDLCRFFNRTSVEVNCDVYYDGVGCFNSSLTCHWRDPDSPQEIGTSFTLYTRQNRNNGSVLDWEDQSSITSSHFSADRDTKFLVHGYMDSMDGDSWIRMNDALLDNYDVNVVMVDWQTGARKDYSKSSANTRVVGRLIAEMMRTMNAVTGASYGSMHIIGHSLGAHTGGYAGEALGGSIGRVSGMDPAGPGFSGDLDNACRLDRTDALFVDVQHTDGDFTGLMDELGHQDFYPNGGKDMPGCVLPKCDHIRAVEYYTESITPLCSFFSTGWAATSDDIKRGNWQTCLAYGCPQMGYQADASNGTGAFYLETNGDNPCCQGCLS